jgi:hypothetical protein
MELDLGRAKRVFEIYDADNSGTIDSDEIAAIFRVLGLEPAPEELREMIAKADTTNTGELSFEDFCTAMQDANSQGDQQEPQPPTSPNSSCPGGRKNLARNANTPYILREANRKKDRRKSLAKRFENQPHEYDYFEQLTRRQTDGMLDLTDLLTSKALDSLDSVLAKKDGYADPAAEIEDTFGFQLADTPTVVDPEPTSPTKATFTKGGTISISLMGALTEQEINDPTLPAASPNASRRRATGAMLESNVRTAAPDDALMLVIKLLEGRFHNALMVLSKRVEKLTKSCRDNGNAARHDEGIVLLRDVTKELCALAGMVQNRSVGQYR